MHELRRRTYLDTLGIDSYVSRAQLAGAAPTQRLLVVRRQAPVKAPMALKPAVTTDASPVPPVLGSLSGQKPADKPKAANSPAETPANAQPAAIPSFSVAAISCGGWLWIEELSQAAVSRDQVHLVQAMVRALGLDNKKLDVSQFDWPIHRNAQLDLGDEAARAGLGGFVQRKASQEKCQGFILLGEACQSRLGSTQLDSSHCIRTISTARMLRDSSLKKQVWEDLQAIARQP